MSEIDDILEREARQERAFRSRRNPVLIVRCKGCRKPIGDVFNSDEGLVLVAWPTFVRPRGERLAKLTALRKAGKRSITKMMVGSGLRIIELLDDQNEGDLIRHGCLPDARPIDWQHIRERIGASEPDARI